MWPVMIKLTCKAVISKSEDVKSEKCLKCMHGYQFIWKFNTKCNFVKTLACVYF